MQAFKELPTYAANGNKNLRKELYTTGDGTAHCNLKENHHFISQIGLRVGEQDCALVLSV